VRRLGGGFQQRAKPPLPEGKWLRSALESSAGRVQTVMNGAAVVMPPPPKSTPPPAQPTCTVELWYRPVEDSGGHTHAYLKVSLTFEGQTSTDQIEGGPQRRSLLDPGNLVRRDYPSDASNSTRKDNHKWGGTLTSAQDPTLCDKLGKVYVGVQYVQDHPVQYSFNGPNSNSYMNYLLQYSGISGWITAPPGAWAWGVRLYQ